MIEQLEQTSNLEPDQNRRFLWNWKDITLVTISAVTLLLGGAIALTIFLQRVMSVSIQIDNAPLAYYAALAVLEAAALAGGVLIFGLLRRKYPWSSVGFIRTSSRWLTAASFAAIISIPLAGAAAALVQMLLNRPVESPQMGFILPENFSWLGAAGMFFGAGLLVPVAEELFFRGLLYTWMRQGLAAWIAIPLNGILFGLVHGEIAVTIATALLGIVLAWFYERSRSLWPAILIHVLVNSVQLGLIYVMVAAGLI